MNKYEDLSDKHYLFLEFTFENRSNEWKDLRVQSLGFPNSKNEILVNNRLKSWTEGLELRIKKYLAKLLARKVNPMSIDSLNAFSNLKLAIYSNNYVPATGAVPGTLKSLDKTNSRKVLVPNTHILAPIQVAPDSYARRWVVLRKLHIPNESVFRSSSKEDTKNICKKYKTKIDSLKNFAIQISNNKKKQIFTFSLLHSSFINKICL